MEKDIAVQILEKLGGLEQRFDNLEQRFDGLEQKMLEVKEEITDLQLGQDRLRSELKKIEVTQRIISGDIDEMRRDIKVIRNSARHARTSALMAHDDIGNLSDRLDAARI